MQAMNTLTVYVGALRKFVSQTKTHIESSWDDRHTSLSDVLLYDGECWIRKYHGSISSNKEVSLLHAR